MNIFSVRIQPSPSLCLMVEVQAARDLDVYDHEALRMGSWGWTRLDLFDQYNQVYMSIQYHSNVYIYILKMI